MYILLYIYGYAQLVLIISHIELFNLGNRFYELRVCLLCKERLGIGNIGCRQISAIVNTFTNKHTLTCIRAHGNTEGLFI